MKATMFAIVLGLLATPVAAQFGAPPPPADPNAPVPKLANGKPDLSGSWQGAGGGQQGSGGDMFRRCTPFQTKNCMEWTNQSEDWVFMSATRLDQRQPLYKPEHWDKMIELDQWTNKYDPVMTCLPLGIPRQGPPARIFQTENDITMLYRGGGDGGGGYAGEVEQLIGAEAEDRHDFGVESIDSASGRSLDEMVEGGTPPLDARGYLSGECPVAVVVEPFAGLGDGRRQVGAPRRHGIEDVEGGDARARDHRGAWRIAPAASE